MLSLRCSSQPAASTEAGISLIPYPLRVIPCVCVCVSIGGSSCFSSDGASDSRAAVERRLRQNWDAEVCGPAGRRRRQQRSAQAAEKLARSRGGRQLAGGRRLRRRRRRTDHLERRDWAEAAQQSFYSCLPLEGGGQTLCPDSAQFVPGFGWRRTDAAVRANGGLLSLVPLVSKLI